MESVETILDGCDPNLGAVVIGKAQTAHSCQYERLGGSSVGKQQTLLKEALDALPFFSGRYQEKEEDCSPHLTN